MSDSEETLLDPGALSRSTDDANDRASIGPRDKTTLRAPTLPRGSRVGEYVIDGLLAAGGFGFVYRATHEGRGTKAAIKILHADLAARPEVVLRFEREIEAVQRIQHPNVVEILAHGRLADGLPYLVMDQLAGVTLEQHLRAHGRLPPEAVLAILSPLASGLEAAHARAIVHRDIKASNVFLCDRDGAGSSSGASAGFHVMLLDFGVAKLLDATGPELTSSRHLVGTLTCMSPEQLLGQPVDLRTDVYALGALTYRMLVGALPFGKQPTLVLRELHLYATPPRPSSRAPVSPAFDEVILGAMSKAPAARPTIAVFLASFRAAMEAACGRDAPLEAASARSGLSIYIEVKTDAGALDNPEDDLLADLEAILPFVSAELTKAGLSAAVEIGSSLLFLLDRPDDPARDKEARRRMVATALSVFRALQHRSGRDSRVHVCLCVHAGRILLTSQGVVVGGDLADLAAWVPDDVEEGVYASPKVLASLGIASQPEPHGPGALLRVDAAAAL
jgi:eukaryotic-like serine/threonine-protein kinase